MNTDTLKGIAMGVLAVFTVLLFVSATYAAGGYESPQNQLITDLDGKDTKLCSMDCRIETRCEEVVWCNIPDLEGGCSYQIVE